VWAERHTPRGRWSGVQKGHRTVRAKGRALQGGAGCGAGGARCGACLDAAQGAGADTKVTVARISGVLLGDVLQGLTLSLPACSPATKLVT
jgi:hypothetical protein